MLNQYPLWKYLLVVFTLLLGLVYALPNVYSQDPVIEITGNHGAKVTASLETKVTDALSKAGIKVKRYQMESDRLQIRFNTPGEQLRAQEVVARLLRPSQDKPSDYTFALTLSPDVPDWLTAIGGEPMNLGLDLRGGIHVLIDVDMSAAMKNAVEVQASSLRSYLRDQRIHYQSVRQDNLSVIIGFKTAADRDKAESLASGEFRDLTFSTKDAGGVFDLIAQLSKAQQQDIRKQALDQNITTLRNRVNALGVAEPVIQQQGDRRIVVELPGVQDPGKVKELLSATATLEYRLVVGDTQMAEDAAKTGDVPPGAKLYYERNGTPILLKRQFIVTGNEMTSASSGFDQQSGRPAVFVTLDSRGARRMLNVTTDNVGKPMAVVYKERRTVGETPDGKPIKKWVEQVINVATIEGAFGRRFQTTGLSSPDEAHQLAVLLKSGALAAPIDIVEERTIGPSLGQDNINQGMMSVVVGLVVITLFMIFYYRLFGLFADMALLANIVLIVAILSILQATLTLPGIAGIVLTVGMAVDANVLIFERIREELRIGSTPQASIAAGYDKAFSTIFDANITTLIVAVVLFSIGTGPVRGFAVTLGIGIVTSMFTAIIGTRAIVNLIYGRKRVKTLPI